MLICIPNVWMNDQTFDKKHFYLFSFFLLLFDLQMTHFYFTNCSFYGIIFIQSLTNP